VHYLPIELPARSIYINNLIPNPIVLPEIAKWFDWFLFFVFSLISNYFETNNDLTDLSFNLRGFHRKNFTKRSNTESLN
jgi:hypothetical protein